MANMDFNTSLNSAESFIQTIDSSLDGTSIGGDVRSRIFNGFLHLSLEHYCSIIILIRHKMNGSAVALLRPQYEALMRGVYFKECASENELDSFISGKDPIKLYKMTEFIETKLSTNNKLVNFYDTLKREMHDFTHGGYAQVQRRYKDNELICNYSESELTKFIKITKILAAFAAVVTALSADKEELAEVFINEIK